MEQPEDSFSISGLGFRVEGLGFRGFGFRAEAWKQA